MRPNPDPTFPKPNVTPAGVNPAAADVFRDSTIKGLRHIADANKAKLFVELVRSWGMFSLDRRSSACRHYEKRIADLLSEDRT